MPDGEGVHQKNNGKFCIMQAICIGVHSKMVSSMGSAVKAMEMVIFTKVSTSMDSLRVLENTNGVMGVVTKEILSKD